MYQTAWKSSVTGEKRAEDGKVMAIPQFSDSRITVFELMKYYGYNTLLEIMSQVTSAIGNR